MHPQGGGLWPETGEKDSAPDSVSRQLRCAGEPRSVLTVRKHRGFGGRLKNTDLRT